MAYVNIPDFGRYPLFVGKEYLKGFVDGEPVEISYEMYLSAKACFGEFWAMLDDRFVIPMMFIRSGLPIPIDTKQYTDEANTVEEAQEFIDHTWFEIDNQSNMDW